MLTPELEGQTQFKRVDLERLIAHFNRGAMSISVVITLF